MTKKNNSEFNGLTCTQLLPRENIDTFKVSPKLEAIIRANEMTNGVIISSHHYGNFRLYIDSPKDSDRFTTIEVVRKNKKGEEIIRNMITNMKLNNIIEVKQYSKPQYYAYYISDTKQILVLKFDFMPISVLEANQMLLAYIDDIRVVPTIGCDSIVDAIAKYYWIDKILETPGIIFNDDDVQRLTEFLFMTNSFPFRRVPFNYKSRKYTRIRIYDIENASCTDSEEFTGIFETINTLHQEIIPEKEKQIEAALFDASNFDGDSASDFTREAF